VNQLRNVKVKFLPSNHPEGYVNTRSYMATVNMLTNKIELTPINDFSQDAGVICIRDFPCFDTSRKSLSNWNPADFLTSTENDIDVANMVNQKITEVKKIFQRINMTKSYEALFSILWYGTLPCIDIGHISRNEDSNVPSVLKYCRWRGITIDCAAIFTTFPTDSGMCCVFNLNAAEDIYRGKTYTTLVSNLQKYEKNCSFPSNSRCQFFNILQAACTHADPESAKKTVKLSVFFCFRDLSVQKLLINVDEIDPSIPDWYASNNEPKTIPGRNKGLYLMLDAHTGLLSTTSMDTDYTSFKGLISSKGCFPFMAQEGFEIRPGHHNIISLMATKIDADDNMRKLDKTARNCIFYDESSFLKLFKTYTYANCLFECNLFLAQEKYNCIPWYFPISDEPTLICDPWEAHEFLDYMNTIKGGDCPRCLPECNNTIYDTSIVTLPLRKCDLVNMEMSFLCKLSSRKPIPQMFSSENDFSYSRSSTVRNYNPLNLDINFFNKNPQTYNAYEIDIATVEIYFKKSSTIQIGRQSKMNWIDYFSTVGGLLGLVLGMGFVSFIEIFWLALRFTARYLHFNQWVP